MTKEMSSQVVEDVLDILPEEINSQQLSAFILTLVDKYAGGKVSQAMSLLLTSTIVYGRTMGFTDEKIASFLESTAQHLKTEQTPKVH